MDRKGILGLLICGLLFAAHIYISTTERQAELERERAAKLIQQEEQAKEVERNAVAESEMAAVGEGSGIEENGESGETEASAKVAAVPEQEVRLETDKMTFVLTNRGGGIKYAEFKEQNAVVISSRRDGKEEAEPGTEDKVRLNRFGSAAVGSLVEGGVDAALGLNYELLKQSDRSVSYGAITSKGLSIVKTWTLVEPKQEVDSYRINLSVVLKNGSDEATIALGNYGLHAGSAGPLYKGEDLRGTGFFTYDGSLKFKDVNWFSKGFFRGPREAYQEREEGVLYTGVSNQFFATLISKSEPKVATIWAKAPELEIEADGGGGLKRFVSMAWSLPNETLAPGEKESIAYEIFMGPKDNKVVRQLGAGRGEVMHYGWFSLVSRPLNYLLNFYHDNLFSKISQQWAWGFAIILVTFTIRIVIWPLHNASTKTMKRMSKLQPLMAEIKEKYPDDPQKAQVETMKLYKQYQINPLGGCLPMFAQIPIFFGFYSMLRSAVELRGSEFLWVDDLSLPDTVFELPFGLPFLGNPVPINLLPLLMMITMFIQMQITPKTGDAMQRRIFMLMPFMFFFFCYNFASALALYWTSQNIFSIGQTWWTQRQPEEELQKRKPGKKSFMEKLAAKAEAAQKAQKQGKRPGGAATKKAKPKKPRGPRTGG